MYNLIVTCDTESLENNQAIIEPGRFLEYTESSIADQLVSLSNDAVEAITSWPAVFMQEGRGFEEVFIGKIRELTTDNGRVTVCFDRVQILPYLHNESLWKLRNELDIASFEFNRHHWSIKDRDLISTLNSSGIEIESPIDINFEDCELPAPSRAELVGCIGDLSKWSHADLSDFLLEAGVQGLDADETLGSRRTRAREIIKYAVDHPSATTVARELFSSYLFNRISARRAETESFLATIPAATERSFQEPASQDEKRLGRVSNRVFIVHGHDDHVLAEVKTFLTMRALKGVVLHEQPNMGRHLLTKFIDEAESAQFAIVLMTDDDEGRSKHDSDLLPRARQNVILELGYFLAHLQQPNVCALITPGLETPSDFDGIVYIPLDHKYEWKMALERELVAAGLPVCFD